MGNGTVVWDGGRWDDGTLVWDSGKWAVVWEGGRWAIGARKRRADQRQTQQEEVNKVREIVAGMVRQ